MIYGIGTDLVQSSRIADSLEKYGTRFAQKILSENEWSEYTESSRPVSFLANRFAAKEAFSKAIGTGLRHPVSFSNITVMHDSLGKPYFEFGDELDQLIKENKITYHHLSISDEINLASAFVILEK